MTTRTLHVISSTNQLLTDLLSLALNANPDNTWQTQVIFDDDAAPQIGTALFTSVSGKTYRIELTGTCITCAIRVAMITFVDSLNTPETFLFLPAGIELAHLCPGLHNDLAERHIILGAVMHSIEATNAPAELLTHIPLSDHGSNLTPDDERCLAEIHALNLGYADLILLTGDHDSAGGELVEHLRAHDTLLANPFEDNILAIARSLVHRPEDALERIHPATIQAWGGPDGHGTWTLDLTSQRAFHPDRLFDFAEQLGEYGVCARGCFWLASRPTTICSWDALGGSVAISSAGSWDTPADAQTHIVIVGIGDNTTRDAISRAFSQALATDEDMLFAEADDGLDQWLGTNVIEG
ncbi:GTPase, G3E family [Arcanobacterium phocae]|uniref:GTPase, G3E family n=1 Tax=Arcanobacterium phocae TaxID=131112 RepID=A0A1H2LMV4_9ACTO|nr:GTP-binding protein [Arcanobacterium phocae]SDU82343.1 GTPase, G3E family [Arcanobacterium phocae]